jgi:hypothetical protein
LGRELLPMEEKLKAIRVLRLWLMKFTRALQRWHA